MKTIKFFSENGNPSVKIREQVREQTFKKVFDALTDTAIFEKVEKNVNGGFSIPVAQDEGGETVYAHFAMTVNAKTPDEKPVKTKAKKDEKSEVEQISLFE